jgi:ABC-type bacteriocin/lantibiotic exporter with double-glycine peptidase domain
VLMYAIFIGLLNLTLPLGIQAILGLIAGGSISASWAVLSAAVVVGMIFIGILRYLQLSAMEYLERRIMADSAFEFSVRIPHLQLEKLRREYLPELINRFFDTLTLQKGLPKILIDGSTAALQMVISLIVLSIYHSVFLALSAILLIMLLIILRATFSRGMESSLKESKYKYKIAFWLEEVSRVASTFKLSGTHITPVQQTNSLINSYLDARQQHFRVLSFLFFSSLVMRVLVVGGFLIAGGVLVMDNTLNLGQFVAAEILVLYVADSLEKVILTMNTVYDVLTATEKIGQFADLPIEQQEGMSFGDICRDNQLSVEWRDLTYQFDDADLPTLRNLNLQVRSGEKVAIVGYSSSGRSTLMQINSGLIQHYSGGLFFNNLPLKALQINSLRENIGDLSSQEDIFKGTVLQNILLGRDLPMTRVMEVAEEVGLSKFLQEASAGLHTELLPSGKGLSGATIGKILIARAIIGRPSMLVLEEPVDRLSHHDRYAISRMLTSQPATLLCSTEDPTLAAMCDRVVVLKNGEIAQVGTFDEIRRSEHFEWVFRLNQDL